MRVRELSSSLTSSSRRETEAADWHESVREVVRESYYSEEEELPRTSVL